MTKRILKWLFIGVLIISGIAAAVWWKYKPLVVRKILVQHGVIKKDSFIHIINAPVKKIIIVKHSRLMKVFYRDTFKTYRVALGHQPIGHKVKEGDRKTPEGTYRVVHRNPKSQGYKSLKISYPNGQDRAVAKKLGVSPGGDICIHGLFSEWQDPETHWKEDWTWGCIAVNNEEIDEIYPWCSNGTPVTILP